MKTYPSQWYYLYSLYMAVPAGVISEYNPGGGLYLDWQFSGLRVFCVTSLRGLFLEFFIVP